MIDFELVSNDARLILSSLGKSGKVTIQDENGDNTTFAEILSKNVKTSHTLLIKEDSRAPLFGGKMKYQDSKSSFAEAYSVGVMQEWSDFD